MDRSADRSVVQMHGCTADRTAARQTTELHNYESFDSMNPCYNVAGLSRSLGDHRYRDGIPVCSPDIHERNARGDDIPGLDVAPAPVGGSQLATTRLVT